MSPVWSRHDVERPGAVPVVDLLDRTVPAPVAPAGSARATAVLARVGLRAAVRGRGRRPELQNAWLMAGVVGLLAFAVVMLGLGLGEGRAGPPAPSVVTGSPPSPLASVPVLPAPPPVSNAPVPAQPSAPAATARPGNRGGPAAVDPAAVDPTAVDPTRVARDSVRAPLRYLPPFVPLPF